jgi:uncharacterized protein (DUF362 family)
VTVSIVRFDGSIESIHQAIELCDGFANLDRSARILLKPNVSYAGLLPIPLYGMFTTATMVQGVLQTLLEYGCKHISIGEGSITQVLGSQTERGYLRTGIKEVAKKYGVKLLDFSQGPFEKMELGDMKVGVSRMVLDSDFFINMPVLKTHSMVKVSLGFKNLKGCLDMNSRKLFHRTELEHCIYLLNELIKCDLTIIDGIYMLERGPDTVLGAAHRKNLIIASRDRFSCECIGAAILGVNPSEVVYLKEYAEAHNLPLDVAMIQTKGLKLESLKETLQWISDVDMDLLRPAGITGLSVPHPGYKLCSGCYINLILALAILSRVGRHRSFTDTVILCGGEVTNELAHRKLILYGNCSIQKNKQAKYTRHIQGCPPSVMNTLGFMCRTCLSSSSTVQKLLFESSRLLASRTGMLKDFLPQWKYYRPPEFDSNHFRFCQTDT